MKAFRKGDQSQAEITQWLNDLRANPDTPETSYNVTTVFRARLGGEEDYYFGGVNVENAEHRLATHAEEGSMGGMLTGLGRTAEIVETWLMGAPAGSKAGDGSVFAASFISVCGKCLQQIAGLAAPGTPMHKVSLDGDKTTTTLGALLPDVFSFRTLNPFDTATQASPRALSASEVGERLTRDAPLQSDEIKTWLRGLDGIDNVSKTTQSAVLQLDNGAFVAGVKMEEAAFQSMNAIQSAMAFATSEFGPSRIEEAWVYTRGRAEKSLPDGAYGTLTLASLQTVFQHAANEHVMINFMNDGTRAPLKLDMHAACKLAATSRKPFYKP